MTKENIQVISFQSNGIHCLFPVTVLLEWLSPSISGMITRPNSLQLTSECLNVIKVTEWPITQLAWLTGGTKRREDNDQTKELLRLVISSTDPLPICMEFILIIIRHEQIFKEGHDSSKTTDSTGLYAHKQNYIHILGKSYGWCIMKGNLIR